MRGGVGGVAPGDEPGSRLRGKGWASAQVNAGSVCGGGGRSGSAGRFGLGPGEGMPSKLLYFPDEGHWVLKPQNSELWHTTVFEWLDGYLKK
jgi:hypothetical protein